MYCKVLVLLAVAAMASANDLFIAASNNTEGHEKVFDSHFEAQWAITRQTQEVFVNASGVICLINVTDLRPNKDGEARIISGGIRQKNVTISLSSPAAFRGYDFRVEVFSHDMHELERGDRDVEEPEEVPEATGTHDNKAVKPAVLKPEVAGLPTNKLDHVTGLGTVDVTELPTDKPEVTGFSSTTAATDVTGLPADKVTAVPAMEMGKDRVPKESEQPPQMQAFVGFRPRRHGH